MNTHKNPSKQSQTVSSTDLVRNFSTIIRRVYVDKEHLVIERGGLPVAVVLPVNEYEALVKSQR